MKVLWLCNIVLPELSEVFGFKKENMGGWLTGLWNCLNNESIELAICVPIRNKGRMRDGEYKNYKYYSFLIIGGETETNIDEQITRFEEVLDSFNPDVIHIWGTEYEHSYSMTRAAENKDISNKIVVNIQGLLTYYAEVYEYGMPSDIVNRVINNLTIHQGKEHFIHNSEYEKYVLKNVRNVIGRTYWDKACTTAINEHFNYYYCGEILRNKFYESNKWNYGNCEKHSIFVSQASYPIKGFHLVISELGKLKLKYKDLVIRISGINLLDYLTPYSEYVSELLEKYELSDVVEFIGVQSEEEMVKNYLKANVVLSPSIIENSSNSVCEAMLIGVPVVSSFVGGMASIIDHGISGYMYPLSEPNLMSYYIDEIFKDKNLASQISVNAIEKAEVLNDRKKVLSDMLNIYGIINDR